MTFPVPSLTQNVGKRRYLVCMYFLCSCNEDDKRYTRYYILQVVFALQHSFFFFCCLRISVCLHDHVYLYWSKNVFPLCVFVFILVHTHCLYRFLLGIYKNLCLCYWDKIGNIRNYLMTAYGKAWPLSMFVKQHDLNGVIGWGVAR